MALTTLLDLLGLVLIVVAAALFVATFTIPGGIAVAGLSFLTISWVIDFRKGRK